MNIREVKKKDWHAFLQNRRLQIEILGILLVPLIYGGIYLAAFWDPYGHTEELNIAFVNQDVGIETENGYLNYGLDTQLNIENSDDLHWVFLEDQSEAMRGLDQNDYYAAVIIPKDFSETINAIEDGYLKHPEIKYISNDKENYIVSLITGKAADKIQASVNQSILSSLASTLADGLNDVKGGLDSADHGAMLLMDGLYELKSQMPKLSAGINSIAEGSQVFGDKMSDATEGATTLKDGLIKLESNMPELEDGIIELYNGSSVFKEKIRDVREGVYAIDEGVTSLNDNIPKLQEGTETLADGATSLLDAVKELNASTPELVSGAADIDHGADQLKTGIKSASDASDTLADAFSLSEHLMSPLYTDIKKGLGSMNTGLTQVYTLVYTEYQTAAIPDVKEGLYSVLTGLEALNDALSGGDTDALLKALNTASLSDILSANFKTLISGINTIKDTSVSGAYVLAPTSRTNLAKASGILASLDSSVNSYGDSLNLVVVEMINSEVLSGIKQLDTGLGSLYAGASTLTSGTEKFKNSMPTLVDGVKRLENGSDDLATGAITLNQTLPSLSNGISILNEGTLKLSTNMVKIDDAASALNNGLGDLYDTFPTLSDGVTKLSEGSQELTNGMVKLSDAALALNEGAETLYETTPDLEDGVGALYEGAIALESGLATGVEELSNKTQFSSKALKTYTNEVVKLDESHLYEINNYGEGLTPYFMSLALWVGALVMFVIMPFKTPKEVDGDLPGYAIGKFLSFAKVGSIQAMALSVVVLALGLRPVSIPLFFIFNILISCAFIAILQFLNFLMGNVGRLLSMILLILQLTSAGGTFPIELSPAFFGTIGPFLPFTYTVSGLRELIAGVSPNILMKDVTTLIIFLGVSLTLTALMYQRLGNRHQKCFMKEALNEQ
jgi:putative membrane protein